MLLKNFPKQNTLPFFVLFFFQGHDYEEFVKAATADNEIQFVETNNIDVAVVLFPDARPKNNFLGLVKSEPERYETFGELLIFQHYLEHQPNFE